MTTFDKRAAGYDDDGSYRLTSSSSSTEDSPDGQRTCINDDFPPAVSAIGAGPVFADLQREYDFENRFDSADNHDIQEPEVNIPLDIQEWMFETGYQGALVFLIDYLLDALEAVEMGEEHELYAEARVRLEDGFKEYGSKMYLWDSTLRMDNLIEELADATIYHTAGPTE